MPASGGAFSFPPGPRAPAVVQAAIYARDPVGALERWAARHGELFTIRLPGFGRFVFASGPRELRQIFTADPAVLKAGAANGQLVPIVGRRSVLTLDGDDHHRHRRLVMPPVHGERLAAYAQVMHDATRRAMAGWPRGAPFALHPHLLAITHEVILRAVFGIEDAGRRAAFGAMFSELLERWSSPLLPMLAFFGVDLIDRAPWLPVARLKARLDRALAGEIARRRAGGEAPGAAAAAAADVLGLLLAARDEGGAPLGDDELRDELVTMMVAGHETTATALAWAFERLLAHPDALAAVMAELATVSTGGAGGALALEELHRLEYLDAVVREVLRMRPVLAFIARRADAPFELGPYRVPPGTFLCPAIHLTHRRPDLYPEPERFLPERFLGKKIDPYAWLPFGGGGRRCLGMAFALFEMKVILATVLRGARLRLADGPPIRRTLRGITVTPEGGTRVVVE